MPTADRHWSLYGVPEQLECDETQEAYRELQKFIVLALKANPNVLECLWSPLVEHATPEHEELKSIAAGCITRHHAHHYLGFAAIQWKLFQKESPPRVKPLLYVYRVLLTGIHLMRTGEVQANLLALNETARLPHIDELVERKLSGPEKGNLPAADRDFHNQEYERLVGELEQAHESSQLPEKPTAAKSLNDLLVRLRLQRMTLGLFDDCNSPGIGLQ